MIKRMNKFAKQKRYPMESNRIEYNRNGKENDTIYYLKKQTKRHLIRIKSFLRMLINWKF